MSPVLKQTLLCFLLCLLILSHAREESNLNSQTAVERSKLLIQLPEKIACKGTT